MNDESKQKGRNSGSGFGSSDEDSEWDGSRNATEFDAGGSNDATIGFEPASAPSTPDAGIVDDATVCFDPPSSSSTPSAPAEGPSDATLAFEPTPRPTSRRSASNDDWTFGFDEKTDPALAQTQHDTIAHLPGSGSGSGSGPGLGSGPSSGSGSPWRSSGDGAISHASSLEPGARINKRGHSLPPGATSPSVSILGSGKTRIVRTGSGEWQGARDETDFLGYEILSTLGEGGMGVVYKARQQGLNRLVALKMIRGGQHASARLLDRFRAEAEAVARLDHPNIVRIFDIGEDAGMPYFSLELLEGGNLADKLNGDPQPPREAAKLMIILSRAMAAAHDAKIIHRDLKPPNIMFSAEGVAKITDFGLAKKLEQEEGYTVTGQVMGTPSYMAPEQAAGRTDDFGPETDVYALGSILYEMLTGRPPFKAATPMATVYQVVHEDPLPPSRLVLKIPRDLETICLKCLQKDRQKRYQTADGLANDLQRYLDGAPILARPTPAWEIALKWVKRHPAATGLIALVVALGVGLTAGLVRYQQYRFETRISENKARDQARQIRDKVLDSKLHEAELKLASAKNEMDNERWTEAGILLQEIKSLIGVDPKDHEERPALGRMLIDAQNLQSEAQVADRRKRDREDAQVEFARFKSLYDQALFLNARFTGLAEIGDPDKWRKVARQALLVYAREPAPSAGEEWKGDWILKELPSYLTKDQQAVVELGFDDLILVLAHAIAQPTGRETPAEQATKALRLLEGPSERLRRSRALHLMRAEYYRRIGDQAAARASDAKEAELRSQAPSAFDAYEMGWTAYRNNDFVTATRYFEQAVQNQASMFWAQALLGISQIQTKRYNEAKIALSNCINDNQAHSWLYIQRGFALSEEGNTKLAASKVLPKRADQLRLQADELFRQALDDFDKAETQLAKQSDAQLSYALSVNRGLLRYRRGQLDEAIKDLEAAASRAPDRYHAYSALAEAHRKKAADAKDRGDLASAHRSNELAIQAISRGLELKDNPNRESFHRARARMRAETRPMAPEARQLALDDLSQAIALERKANFKTKEADDWALRGDLLLEAKDCQAAVDACREALAIDPKHPRALATQMMALLELKRFDEVIRLSDSQLEAAEPSLEILQIRGLARSSKGDHAKAISDFTAALDLKPDSRAAEGALRSLRGWTHLQSQSYSLAEIDFRRAIELDPKSADAHSGRAVALVSLGQPKLAVNDAERAIELSGGSPSQRLLLIAARACASAAAAAARETNRRGREAVGDWNRFRDLGAKRLNQAAALTPAAGRSAFLRETLNADPALRSLLRR